MGTNGKEISCERKKTKFAKRAIQTKIPLKRKFDFRIIIPGKKFPKIWITSRGCPCALFIGPKFPKSWYGNYRRKFPENLEIVEFPKSEPFNRKLWKSRDENQMDRKFQENTFENLGVAREAALFFGKYSRFFIYYSALVLLATITAS